MSKRFDVAWPREHLEWRRHSQAEVWLFECFVGEAHFERQASDADHLPVMHKPQTSFPPPTPIVPPTLMKSTTSL
jgi:hypothetical protein